MRSAGQTGAAHVTFADVHMAFGAREVFRTLSCGFPAGKLSVILGGSGSGKSTMLRLMGGLVRPLAGTIDVDGLDVTRLSESHLYEVRRKLGMMFQGGALLDSMTVFDNLALPLRERAIASENEIADLVHTRLDAVGLHDVDDLLPGQLSGGMVKRVAVARATMMEPAILLCDEPFSGLDPVSAARIERLLLGINRELGITIILVSHSVASTLRMADHILLLLPDGPVEGPPTLLAESTDARVQAFLSGEVDESLISSGEDLTPGMITPVQQLGGATVRFVEELGRLGLFAVAVARATVSPPLRFRLFVTELFKLGVLSLIIVCVCGLAVGMVLSLQGYNTLVRFGAEESLGAVVGLSLVRELGPVLTALLATGRAGSATAAEIGTMVATEQLDGLRMMSIDPIDLVVTPKALAMIVVMPLLSALFIVSGLAGGYLVGVQLMGVDSGSYVSSMQSSIDFYDDIVGSLLKALVFGVLVGLIATHRGYRCTPTSAGVSAATTSTVVVASVSILISDYFITALWGV